MEMSRRRGISYALHFLKKSIVAYIAVAVSSPAFAVASVCTVTFVLIRATAHVHTVEYCVHIREFVACYGAMQYFEAALG